MIWTRIEQTGANTKWQHTWTVLLLIVCPMILSVLVQISISVLPSIEWTDKSQLWITQNETIRTYICCLYCLWVPITSNESIWQSTTTYSRRDRSEKYVDVFILPERTINCLPSTLSIETPRNCGIYGWRASLYRMCQNSWNGMPGKQNTWWFDKFQMILKNILPIIGVDAMHFNAQLSQSHRLHFHGHNALGTGT